MFKLLLSPGIQIISRFSIAKKFILIFILYLIPVGYVAYYAVTNHSKALNETQQEIQKLKIISAFKTVFSKMALSRGLSEAYNSGNQSVSAKLNTAVEKVNDQLARIENLAQFSELTKMEQSEFNRIMSGWRQ